MHFLSCLHNDFLECIDIIFFKILLDEFQVLSSFACIIAVISPIFPFLFFIGILGRIRAISCLDSIAIIVSLFLEPFQCLLLSLELLIVLSFLLHIWLLLLCTHSSPCRTNLLLNILRLLSIGFLLGYFHLFIVIELICGLGSHLF